MEKKKGRGGGAKRERLEERLEGSIGYGLWSRYGFCLGLEEEEGNPCTKGEGGKRTTISSAQKTGKSLQVTA